MPYFISDQNPDCAGWAVEKEDGEVVGCHQSKEDAIAQMVAVSLAEDVEPGGERQVDLTVPKYIRDAAARGIELHEEGKSGNVVARTVREARLMAAGDVSEDKVIRANAWGQRHLVDLEASQNSDSTDDGWPGRGAVAFYLWGINPLDPEPAMNWFARKAEQIRDEDRGLTFWRQGGSVEAVDKVETRRIAFNEFELREAESGMSFAGYAAVFNQDSEPLPFIERIQPGAFAKSLRSRNNVRMYMNHDSSMLLATTRAKTLRLSEDAHGLRVEADLPDTTVGRDLATLMKRGDVDSMSFGFTVPRGGDKWSDDGATRTLTSVRLFEVSVVTGFPAYTGTSASVRSLDELATRTGQDADQLAAALTVLESGENLTADQAGLLRETVAKLAPVEPTAPSRLDVLRKRIDLQYKSL